MTRQENGFFKDEDLANFLHNAYVLRLKQTALLANINHA